MKKSTKTTNKYLKAQIKSRKKQLDCDHLWVHYGFGYSCARCNYYTGMNSTLNKIITEELQ